MCCNLKQKIFVNTSNSNIRKASLYTHANLTATKFVTDNFRT